MPDESEELSGGPVCPISGNEDSGNIGDSKSKSSTATNYQSMCCGRDVSLEGDKLVCSVCKHEPSILISSSKLTDPNVIRELVNELSEIQQFFKDNAQNFNRGK